MPLAISVCVGVPLCQIMDEKKEVTQMYPNEMVMQYSTCMLIIPETIILRLEMLWDLECMKVNFIALSEIIILYIASKQTGKVMLLAIWFQWSIGTLRGRGSSMCGTRVKVDILHGYKATLVSLRGVSLV